MAAVIKATYCPHCKTLLPLEAHRKGAKTVSVIEAKYCARCNKLKPLDAYSRGGGASPSSQGFTQSYCKQCGREYGRERAQERREEREAEALREDVAATRVLRAAGLIWKANDPEWDAKVNAALAAEDAAGGGPETNGAGRR
jgi:hypothetical protein